MTYLQALLLGIVQGLTEFLPISSSGHLVLFQEFLNLSAPPLLFDIVIHVGTLAAVFIYFRHQLFSVFKSQFHNLLIATIPAVIFGFFIYEKAQAIFSDLYLVGLGFLATSFLLFINTLFKPQGKPLTQLTLKGALIIGIFQAASIIPSLSRSGATIVSGQLVGLSAPAAFTFSFILSIPAITGALILGLPDLTSLDSSLLVPASIGFIVSLITGILSLKLLDLVLNRKNLLPFAYYTLVLGALILGLFS